MQEPDERPEMRAIPALPEKFSEGRDELNFAEFPLGTIAERIDPTVKTLGQMPTDCQRRLTMKSFWDYSS